MGGVGAKGNPKRLYIHAARHYSPNPPHSCLVQIPGSCGDVMRRPALASAGQRISNAYLGGQGQTASGSAEARNRAAFQRPPHLEANYKFIIRCESKLPCCAPAVSNCHFFGAQLAFWFYYATAHIIPHRNQLPGLFLRGSKPPTPWACFDTNLQYAWHKPFSLQSNQVRKVDRKLLLMLIALVSQLTFLRVIVEITLILLSQYAGSKGI